jgi:lipopolysaccharide heptosyltransferase I
MRILIVKLSALGDIIHTLPAVAWLRRARPEADITWVVERPFAELLEASPVLDRLLVIETRQWRRAWGRRATWREMSAAVRSLRRQGFDLAIDFQGLVKSSLMAALSGARRRLGRETAALKEPLSRIFLTEQVAVLHHPHIIDQHLELVRRAVGEKHPSGPARADDPSADYEFPLRIPPPDREVIERALSAAGIGEFVLLVPGGGWAAKRWPPACFSEIADFLHEAYALEAVIPVGPGEESLASEIVSRCRRAHPLVLACTLTQLAALCDRARLVVGGDTGPLHLAAARRTPLVALYGPTAARRNGPFDPRDEVVEQVPADGYRYYSRRAASTEMLRIGVEPVKRAIERRLARLSRNSPEVTSERP